MDQRIESYLTDVLALEGQDSNRIREGVRFHLAKCEKHFRDSESNKRMKDTAAYAGRRMCRARVLEEAPRHRGTSTAEHLRLVLEVIDGTPRFPLKG